MPSIPGLISLFNAQNPGMSQRVNPSLINLDNIGQATSGMPTPPTSEDYNAEPDLTRANELEKAAYEMTPPEVRSNIGTKDILALIFAGLAGSEGGNVLQGYMQGKQAAQAQREALAAQKYQQAQQQKLQEAASIRAGIPIKQSRIAKRNEEKLKQFETLADIYNKGQSELTKKDLAGQTNETKQRLAEIASQDRRIKANTDALMKLPVESRAPWARENLGVTDPEILSSLGNLTPQNKKDIAAANNLKAKTDTIVALRPGQIKNLNNRNAYLASQSGLTDKKAITEVARATVLLPAEAALKVAQAKALTMNANTALKRVNAYIAKDGSITNDKKYQKALDVAKTSLISADKAITTASTRATELRTEYGIVLSDKSATQEQKDAIETALFDADTYLKTLKTDRDYYEKQLDNLQTMGGLVPKRPQMPKLGLFGFPDGTFPHVPGKDDISMDNVNQSSGNTGIPYKTKSKPTATPPKGKTVKKINNATVSY